MRQLVNRLCCLLMLAVCGFNAMNAQVTVDVSIDSLELFIGEQTKIRLDVSMDAGSKFTLPKLKDRSMLIEGVEVLEVSKPDTQSLNGGKRWLVSQDYLITSFDSALYFIPPLELEVEGKPYASQALALKVYSIPVDTLHPEAFFPHKDIHKIPLRWSDIAPLFWAVVFLLLLGAAAVFLFLRYRDNKPIIRIIKIQPKLPPHVLAMQSIEKIKADKAMQREDPKAYYTQLTEAVRNYIKERFGFNAMEMTTSEIIERLLQEKDKESIADLRRMFETADLVKFAKYAPLMNVNDMNLVNAVEFINQTKIEEDPNAKKEPTEIKVEEKRSKKERIILICLISVAGVGAVVCLVLTVKFIIDLFF